MRPSHQAPWQQDPSPWSSEASFQPKGLLLQGQKLWVKIPPHSASPTHHHPNTQTSRLFDSQICKHLFSQNCPERGAPRAPLLTRCPQVLPAEQLYNEEGTVGRSTGNAGQQQGGGGAATEGGHCPPLARGASAPASSPHPKPLCIVQKNPINTSSTMQGLIQPGAYSPREGHTPPKAFSPSKAGATAMHSCSALPGGAAAPPDVPLLAALLQREGWSQGASTSSLQ